MNDDTTTERTVSDDAIADDASGTISDCAETMRELDIFLDGEISVEQRDAIRAHLDGCMDCLGAFDFHAELKMVIAAKCQNDEMPPGLLNRIERCFGTDFDDDGKIG